MAAISGIYLKHAYSIKLQYRSFVKVQPLQLQLFFFKAIKQLVAAVI